MTPILGTPACTAQRASQWAAEKGAPQWWCDLAPVCFAEGTKVGVRGDVMWAQACKETGFGYRWTSPDSVLDASYRNPCGFKTAQGGADDDPNAHWRSPDWETGFRAQAHHLWDYAQVGKIEPSPDPRPLSARLSGSAPNVEGLSGKWAPSRTYHLSILRHLEEMMMSSGYYLLDNPPRRQQFYETRRARPTGTIVIHTAENLEDLHPPDTGAEDVASFIRGRTTAGSYHRLCDQNSIVKLVPFSYTAFHDGTGSNPWSIGISGALRADQWDDLTPTQRMAYAVSMAEAAKEAAAWLKSEYGIVVPARRLTRATYDQPGFCSHKDREDWFGTPGRRSDPGEWFPWDVFFNNFQRDAQQEEEMTYLAWFREKAGNNKSVHCYRIEGGVCSWFADHDQIGAALWLGGKWIGGSEEKSFLDPKIWRSMAVLNGPLQNVPSK